VPRARVAVVAGLLAGSMLIGCPRTPRRSTARTPLSRTGRAPGWSARSTRRRWVVGAPEQRVRRGRLRGLVWHTYDLGCAGAVSDPSVNTDTWLGNQTFNPGQVRRRRGQLGALPAGQGGDVLTPLDQVLTQATKAMYDGVFSTFIGPALLLLALILLALAFRGDLAKQGAAGRVRRARADDRVRRLPGPGELGRVADGLLLDGVTQMQQGFLNALARATWTRCHRAHRPGGLQQLAARRVRARPPTEGPSSSAAPCSTRRRQQDRAGRGKTQQADVGRQKQAFADVAGKMGDRYPTCRASRQPDRVGVLAVIQAVCIALFQLLSQAGRSLDSVSACCPRARRP